VKLYIKYLFIFILFAISSCGSTPTADPITTNSETISIIGFTFLPDTISADPGQTIFFYNRDAIVYQILSQSAPDQFDDTGLFESLIIETNQVQEITIPSTATSGSTLFFYDNFLQDTMATPNGTININ